MVTITAVDLSFDVMGPVRGASRCMEERREDDEGEEEAVTGIVVVMSKDVRVLDESLNKGMSEPWKDGTPTPSDQYPACTQQDQEETR